MKKAGSPQLALPSAEAFFAGKTACCFTGHRPAGLPDTDGGITILRTRLMETVLAAADAGVTQFLAGGAQGFDTFAAEAVLFLKQSRSLPLTLTLALPSPRQAERWSTVDRERYETILDGADEIFYAGETNDAPQMYRRNRYLVDHADCCVCYLRNMQGGTLYTVNYALERGLPVYNLALLV